VIALGLGPLSALAQVPQPGTPQPENPSVVVDPAQPGASPHWTITVFEPYCGGYKIGDGVYLSPEAPISIPQSPADGSILFAGQPASVSQVGNALRVAPSPDTFWSMVCMPGNRSLTVELLPQAGMALPDAGGTYAVDYWTGANPTPVTLSFDVPAIDSTPAPGDGESG
jgi:hypothetical protein